MSRSYVRLLHPLAVGSAIAAFLAANPCHAQLPPVIDLGAANSDVTVFGAAHLDKLGMSLTSGDVNGDSHADWILFSAGASPLGRQGAGIVYVLWGGDVWAPTIDLASPEEGTSVIFPPAGDVGLDAKVHVADLNKDGFDDIVFGVPLGEYPSFYAWGKAFIVFGRQSFPDTLDLQSPPGFVTTITPEDDPWVEGWLGWGLSSGDVNGDTYEDLIISAPVHDPGGRFYVIYGRDDFPATIDLDTALTNIVRVIEPDHDWAFGATLATGDVDADGYADVLVGSTGNGPGRYHGKGTLYFGGPEWPDTISLPDASVRSIEIASDASQEGGLGAATAIGDVDHDGYGDMVISASLASRGDCTRCGEVYVIYGSSILPSYIHVQSETISMTRLLGTDSDTEFGTALCVADISGDQRGDLIISSLPDYGIPGDVSKVTVVYGTWTRRDSILLGDDPLATRILGETQSDDFGYATGSADMNEDGIGDLFVGAYREAPFGRSSAGAVHLFYGVSDPTGIFSPHSPHIVLHQNYPNPFGTSTAIDYILDDASTGTLTIYDVVGRRVVEFELPPNPSGRHTFVWDGQDEAGRTVASGMYFCHLRVNGVSQTKKMLLVR